MEIDFISIHQASNYVNVTRSYRSTRTITNYNEEIENYLFKILLRTRIMHVKNAVLNIDCGIFGMPIKHFLFVIPLKIH